MQLVGLSHTRNNVRRRLESQKVPWRLVSTLTQKIVDTGGVPFHVTIRNEYGPKLAQA
jgi:hypothetical protein